MSERDDGDRPAGEPRAAAPENGAGDASGYGRQRSGWLVVVGMLAAIAGGIGFAWAYAADTGIGAMGGFLALGLAGIGLALAYWGRNLVGDKPAADTYPIPHRDEDAAAELGDELQDDVHVLTRRRFLTGLLVAGTAVFGLSQLVLAGSLGPRPRRSLFETSWRAGSRLVTFDGKLVGRDALRSGGFLVVFPEGAAGSPDSQVVLLRLSPELLKPLPGRETWSPDGFVAYSRVCTHAGCSVAQYEDESHLLLCPCHQSTFDVLRGAQPVSGPAGRALPQLPLSIGADGYLVAQGGFSAPAGPGFWDLP